MAGETEASRALEVIPLRDHMVELRRTDLENWRAILVALELRLQQRFDAQESSVATAMTAAEKAVNAALISSEKAVDKAEQAQALRNIVANEFRGTIADTTATMWAAKEGQAAVKALEDKMIAEMAGMRRERTAIFEGLDARLKAMELYRAETRGQGTGSATTWGTMHTVVVLGFGAVAMIATIIATVVLLR